MSYHQAPSPGFGVRPDAHDPTMHGRSQAAPGTFGPRKVPGSPVPKARSAPQSGVNRRPSS
jgi:hypothetical protein